MAVQKFPQAFRYIDRTHPPECHMSVSKTAYLPSVAMSCHPGVTLRKQIAAQGNDLLAS